MAHLIKLELKKFGTARNIIFTFAAILFSILFITVSLWDSMTDPEQTKDTFESTYLVKLIMVRTKIFVKEDTKMLYTEKEKHEIERVKEVFAEHLRQSPDFELLWSDKVGYVWLAIGVNPVYVDTGIRIESAADLCGRCLDDVAMDVLYMTGNDHALEAADPLELAEIKRRWEPYINQLPDYAYLCKDLLNRKM